MSKIAGELNAEMSKTIGSKEYNEWLNSPLTKALKRSFEQSITDPENQPSQYGTVTLAMYEHLEEQITASQQRVAELEKERDKATQYWQIAEGRCDALMKQRFKDAAECDEWEANSGQWEHEYYKVSKERDELLAAAVMAVEMIEYNKHERRHVRWKLNDAIASVKEKQNAAD